MKAGRKKEVAVIGVRRREMGERPAALVVRATIEACR